MYLKNLFRLIINSANLIQISFRREVKGKLPQMWYFVTF